MILTAQPEAKQGIQFQDIGDGSQGNGTQS